MEMLFLKNKKKEINDFCNKNNLNLISVGYLNKWIKKNYIDLDPTGFFQLIKKSTFVFTSMFHGIMFSVKLQKQFYYVVDPIRENKINFFVNKLNLKEREIKELETWYIEAQSNPNISNIQTTGFLIIQRSQSSTLT